MPVDRESKNADRLKILTTKNYNIVDNSKDVVSDCQTNFELNMRFCQLGGSNNGVLEDKYSSSTNFVIKNRL